MSRQVVRALSRPGSIRGHGRDGFAGPGLEGPTIELVRAVDPLFAAAMEEHPFESSVEPVPFWTNTRLRSVFVKTAFRTRSRPYADDGVSLSPISRPEAIYAINAREQLLLEPALLPAYVRFFVANAGVGRGMRIVEDELGAAFVDDKWLSPEAVARKNEALRAIRPIACAGGIVVASAIRALDLVEVTIKVAPSGIVEALTTVIVVEDVPVVS